MKTTRLNMRANALTTKKVRYLAKATGATVSDVLQEGIDLYYARLTGERALPRTILKKNAFVGSGSGPADLSTSYKQALTESWSKKLGHR